MSPSLQRIIRFIISGATATGLIIVLLYGLTKVFHIWYLASSVLAFIIATVVSFLLQKYWAFKDHRSDVLHKQAAAYFVLQLWDLVLNTALLYVGVTYLHLWYLLAQFCVSAIIAVQNFLVYRAFIFKNRADTMLAQK